MLNWMLLLVYLEDIECVEFDIIIIMGLQVLAPKSNEKVLD